MEKLQPVPEAIQAFSVFPSSNLAAGSFQYIPSDYLGIKGLTGVLSADYRSGDNTSYTLFLSAELGAGKLDSLFAAMKKTWQEIESLAWHTTSPEGKQLFMVDTFQGNTAIIIKGGLLAGLTGNMQREAAFQQLKGFFHFCKNHLKQKD